MRPSDSLRSVKERLKAKGLLTWENRIKGTQVKPLRMVAVSFLPFSTERVCETIAFRWRSRLLPARVESLSRCVWEKGGQSESNRSGARGVVIGSSGGWAALGWDGEHVPGIRARIPRAVWHCRRLWKILKYATIALASSTRMPKRRRTSSSTAVTRVGGDHLSIH